MSTARESSPSAYIDPMLRRWVRIPTVECNHASFSQQMIMEAARTMQGGSDAIVLGAGNCQEIPLAALAERCPSLTLNDLDESLLDAAIAASGLSVERKSEITKRVADLTGVTAGFLGEIDAILGETAGLSPETAVERFARVADAVRTVPFATGRRYDLVVASCVLCQLHLAAWNQAIARFGARFPGRELFLQRSPAWASAMQGLARRMEASFVDALHGLVTPQGRIYFSDTVQCAMLHEDHDAPGWLSDGFLRMTRTPQLNDYLDHRFRIELAGRWLWVLKPSLQENRTGRLFRVQAFVVSTIG